MVPKTALDDNGKVQNRIGDHRALDSPQVIVHLRGKEAYEIARRVPFNSMRIEKILHKITQVKRARLDPNRSDRIGHR